MLNAKNLKPKTVPHLSLTVVLSKYYMLYYSILLYGARCLYIVWTENGPERSIFRVLESSAYSLNTRSFSQFELVWTKADIGHFH